MPWKDPEKIAQAALLAALAAGSGLLDYMYGLYKNRYKWSFLYFFLHAALAGFTGWLVATGLSGLGYAWETQVAAAGLAGFMNVRALELFEAHLGRKGKN